MTCRGWVVGAACQEENRDWGGVMSPSSDAWAAGAPPGDEARTEAG